MNHPLHKLAEASMTATPRCTEEMDYVGAKNIIMELVHAANHYIEDAAPWTVVKDRSAHRLAEIIYTLLESIRICALFMLFARLLHLQRFCAV